MGSLKATLSVGARNGERLTDVTTDEGRECGQREASGQRERMWAWWLVCDPILVLFWPC